jgi:hypothetical protein
MPVFSLQNASGEPPIFSSTARHWSRVETPASDIVNSSTLSDSGLIPCQLTRNVGESALDEMGISASEAGRVKMPLSYWQAVKIGDELQIDGQRFQVLTSPVRHAAIQAIAHCEVVVRTAQVVGA